MRILRFLCFSLLLLSTAANAQKTKNGYHYMIDLQQSGDDKFNVELTPPQIKSKTIVFHLPKTVPGTYSNDDYGYFANDLKAFAKNGKELSVTRLDVNSWQINDANQLAKITYKVDDTFDDKTRKEKVFEPTGSGVQHDTAYVMNTYTVMGYFSGMEQLPYTLSVKHKPDFYGSTAMKDIAVSPTLDVFTAGSYNEIADNPIMYTRPDTTTIRVGGAEILISVYSPNKLITSSFLATKLDSLTRAQVKYLGGKLPVTKYAYLIYLFDKQPVSNAAGALEHSYSSLYSLGETNPEAFAQSFKDVAAHEFFHILTPLNVHAEEIQYFDFTNPKMSEHLWLYEGSTEYHAHKAQVQSKLITVDRFLTVMGSKITSSRTSYNDTLPFTYMSKHVLEPAYEPQYGNVYQKGALINMVLDIKLRQLSNGKYGLMNLMQDLSAKYGKGKPFKDEELFSVIGKQTYPQIQEYLQNHVGGNKALPLEDAFNAVGIRWLKDTTIQVFSFGNFRPRAAGNTIYVSAINTMDDFGKKMDYRVNDTIVSINGTPVNRGNYAAVTGKIASGVKEGDQLKVEVLRMVDGKPVTVTLQQPILFVSQKRFNILRLDPNATPAQVALRDAWLNIDK
jgi:predicted metalloprotease with PDZ domain